MTIIRNKKSRKLDLSNQKFDKFPLSIFGDKNISIIDLSYNHIREIPANISELKKLRYLNLENNEISQLHKGILEATSLKVLYLQGNQIKRIPNFIKEKATFSIYTDNEVFIYYPMKVLDDKKDKLMNEISSEVDSIIYHNTSFDDTSNVPKVESLTFNRHEDRKGCSLISCVLFVDIRDSVKKNMDHMSNTLARMYSSFIYGVLRISKEYNGHVRNIIGDRVMIVFDKDFCCDNAVKCAGSIMTFCDRKMGRTLPYDKFRCGIGIHYGKMDVIKVGLSIQGPENAEYQNMVWIGEPANFASRLTDNAGKENIPSVVISQDVFNGLKYVPIKKYFVHINKSRFKDININVLGCNFYIK